MIQAVQGRLRERIIAETSPSDADGLDLVAYARRIWQRTSDPARDGEFRLLFAVYGRALQAPDSFPDFLDHVVTDPLAAFAGVAANDADPRPTLLIAAIRGLILDLLTTGDRDRVGAAADALFTVLRTDLRSS